MLMGAHDREGHVNLKEFKSGVWFILAFTFVFIIGGVLIELFALK